ncbi:biotin--[acetyl-CoA-carboxylase] ligase [Endobacter medicaginis]|uniref:biotin--[biotin carboxyl-carrier protein] ligase n=1 Tax=Endobacter medicaginis TaxID=1181271 RepID=A0A850NLU4_9PROT|nr:biotin--[acetyl-CoA-carboxylase] ligase [Endobacter medicaginis]MCX5475452.1 biotin--[acetyl-CoA-carboxylase] ligase [Endobacter medicaginis]NVN28890.1 biotin--[acetyl-CoA-carboxylase] ligase [Endobacter medicaginis]
MTDATAPLFRLTRHPALPSTSDHLLALAEADAPDGEAVLAYVQTRGRGSRGRSWFDAPGNLALSVLLRREIVPTLWPFAAACATYDALVAHGARELHLKWPNDLLDASGGKVAGILVESGRSASGGFVVIGIGANLAAAPLIAPGRTRPGGLGLVDGVDAVAETLLARLAHWTEIAEDKAFAAIRAAWLERAHALGTPLVVNARDGAARHGRFAGIDAEGALLLDTPGGIERIATGDVLELSGAAVAQR